jgi:predicted nucleotidyltransferase
MRLSPEQAAIIRSAAAEVFGADARVWLFGSRVDDNRHGGDIDLLIEAQRKPALQQTLTVQARLEQQLGTPVDLITSSPEVSQTPIMHIARLTGVPLA